MRALPQDSVGRDARILPLRGRSGVGGTLGRAQPAEIRKLPPYSRTLLPDASKTLHVLTGLGAWEKAKSRTWAYRRKVILPFQSDPRHFDWSISRGFADCLIVNEGSPMHGDWIKVLAAELLVHTDRVLYIGAGPSVRFDVRET